MHVMLVSLITNPRVKILVVRGKGFVSNDFVVNASPDFLQFFEKTCNVIQINFGFVSAHCGVNA